MRVFLLCSVFALSVLGCTDITTVPFTPAVSPSFDCGSPPGNATLRELESKSSSYTEVSSCDGGGSGWETVYTFRSTDGWICHPDIFIYYAYEVGDYAECVWSAG